MDDGQARCKERTEPTRLRLFRCRQFHHHEEKGISVLTSSKEILAEGRRQIMFEEPIPLPPVSPRAFILVDYI
jgi:hypothetical protein